MYITERIEERLSDIPAEEQTDVYCFLRDLQGIAGFDNCTGLLEQCRKWDLSPADMSRCFPRLGASATGNIVRMYQRSRYFNAALPDDMDSVLKQLPDLDREKSPAGMGLLTGYAGEGFLRMIALGQTKHSWMFLL
jgi:hypothetical protein